MTIKMTLCPKCKTIQRCGTICGLCKCPIPKDIKEEDKKNDRSNRRDKNDNK